MMKKVSNCYVFINIYFIFLLISCHVCYASDDDDLCLTTKGNICLASSYIGYKTFGGMGSWAAYKLIDQIPTKSRSVLWSAGVASQKGHWVADWSPFIRDHAGKIGAGVGLSVGYAIIKTYPSLKKSYSLVFSRKDDQQRPSLTDKLVVGASSGLGIAVTLWVLYDLSKAFE